MCAKKMQRQHRKTCVYHNFFVKQIVLQLPMFFCIVGISSLAIALVPSPPPPNDTSAQCARNPNPSLLHQAFSHAHSSCKLVFILCCIRHKTYSREYNLGGPSLQFASSFSKQIFEYIQSFIILFLVPTWTKTAQSCPASPSSNLVEEICLTNLSSCSQFHITSNCLHYPHHPTSGLVTYLHIFTQIEKFVWVL